MFNAVSKKMFIVIISLFFVIPAFSQEKAFPGAEGWAAYTPGGRGGSVMRVTNLNASGPGSLAEAVGAAGPKIVVFEVGGIIDMKGRTLTVLRPYITIAGQTAPSPGITIINGNMSITTHDVIIQHIRVRPGASGKSAGWEPDGIATTSAYNVIVDHCSVSWAVDENLSASGPRFDGSTPDDWRDNTSHTITFSNNIIAECLSYATHEKGEHSKGSLIHDNVTEMAIIKNLYAHNKQRNPLFKGGARGAVVNNYIYDPGDFAMRYALVTSEWEGYTYQTGMMSVVGNHLQYGPSSENPILLDMRDVPAQIYLEDNIAKDRSGDDVPEWDGSASQRVYSPPHWHENIQTLSASEVRDFIVENAGARPWDRDEIDTRIIQEMLDGTGKIIDYETEVGGYPDYEMTRRPFDASKWDMNTMEQIAPRVSIKTPGKNAQFKPNATVDVLVEAEDNDGNIVSVELFLNETSRGQLTTSPFTWSFVPPAKGNYYLIAIAEDDSSLQMTSDTVFISVTDTIRHSLQLKSGGNGSVESNPSGSSYVEGANVKINAIPDEGFEFMKWFGDYDGYINPLPLTMDASKSITATFIESKEPELTYKQSFDNLSSVILKDETENNHTTFLTKMDPIIAVPGKYGDAIGFDGVDDYVRVVKRPDLDFDVHGFTFCFWIKQGDGSNMAPWIHFMDDDGVGYQIYQNGQGKIHFTIDDGIQASTAIAEDTEFVTGEWVFVTAMVHRSPDEVRLYANGELIASADDYTGDITSSPRYLLLGTNPDLDQFFNGALDEIRVYNYPISETDIGKLYIKNSTPVWEEQIVQNFPLSVQNYPNPFNPNTEIRYQISEDSHVRLTVYNILGKEVSVLVDEEKHSGFYSVQFNSNDIQNTSATSGVYFCELSACNERVTNKMILMK